MKIANNLIGTKKTINYVIFGLIFTLFNFTSKAQENPPIPVQVKVNTAQNLNFGSFTTGINGGTVTVTSGSNRILPTGDIVLLNMGQPVSAALFDVTANPGTIIQIQPQSSISLTGSNGGSITLNIDSYSTGQTFITTANPPFDTNPVFVGGTLTVGNSTISPPGQYTGDFTLTFIQE
jgi:hypothetical protein